MKQNLVPINNDGARRECREGVKRPLSPHKEIVSKTPFVKM